MEHDGGWVFISHSHLDIETVRQIRNNLEKRGFEPLLFFLKCLNDDNEIEDLICREIKEREWFIYVDSVNSRKSKWVKSEREYIKTLPGKKIFTIDISDNISKQLEKIARQMQVYISYSHHDSFLADKIRKKLIDNEFLVFLDKGLIPGVEWKDEIENTLENTSHNGFVILLVTEASDNSRYVKWEVQTTLQNKGKIVPVFVDNASLSDELMELIGNVQGVWISSNPDEEELQKLVDNLMHRVEYYQSDFSLSDGFTNAERIVYPEVGRIEDYTFCDCDNLKEVTIPPAVRFISETAFNKGQDVLIKCQKGTYAENYCIEHHMKYELID